jgi:hypothetical protein
LFGNHFLCKSQWVCIHPYSIRVRGQFQDGELVFVGGVVGGQKLGLAFL